MIPKIMHHVWVGPDPLPDQEKFFINSWKDLHPDWKFIFWNNDSIKNLDINDDCSQAIQDAGNLYACQADVIRYIAVNTFGGIYIDTDIECFRNIDELIDNEIEFLGLRPHSGNWITNAFFGAIKNSEVLNSVISNIFCQKNNQKNPYGPVFLTRHVRRKFNFKKNQKINESTSSKCSVLNSIEFWNQKSKNPYCRHLFKGSWRKK